MVLASGEVGRRVCDLLRHRGLVPSVLVVDGDELGDAFAGESTRVVPWSALGDAGTLDELRRADLDVGILAWWPHVLSAEVLGLCRRGFLNLHPSLLPHGRGKDPNVWALVDGTPFGVTIHHAVPAVDAGPVAFQRELPVTWTDDGESLYRRAQDALVDLFAEHVDRIVTGDVPAIEQADDRPAHRRAELDAATRIDLDEPIAPRRLLDVLRARTFPGHPGAWFEDRGDRYEVRITIERVED